VADLGLKSWRGDGLGEGEGENTSRYTDRDLEDKPTGLEEEA
jgi:hypothetical protein